jgi:hypothetical protein
LKLKNTLCKIHYVVYKEEEEGKRKGKRILDLLYKYLKDFRPLPRVAPRSKMTPESNYKVGFD